VPIYVPTTVPYKVLDIGRAVRLLQQQNAHESSQFATGAAQPMPAAVSANGVQGANDVEHVAPAQLLTDEDVEDFSRRLRQLAAAPTFSGAAMAHTIDKIHDRARFCCFDRTAVAYRCQHGTAFARHGTAFARPSRTWLP
jgi:hypothetical protein